MPPSGRRAATYWPTPEPMHCTHRRRGASGGRSIGTSSVNTISARAKAARCAVGERGARSCGARRRTGPAPGRRAARARPRTGSSAARCAGGSREPRLVERRRGASGTGRTRRAARSASTPGAGHVDPPPQCVRRSWSHSGYSSGGSGSGVGAVLRRARAWKASGSSPQLRGSPIITSKSVAPSGPATIGPNAAPSGQLDVRARRARTVADRDLAVEDEHDVRAEVAVAAHDHPRVVLARTPRGTAGRARTRATSRAPGLGAVGVALGLHRLPGHVRRRRDGGTRAHARPPSGSGVRGSRRCSHRHATRGADLASSPWRRAPSTASGSSTARSRSPGRTRSRCSPTRVPTSSRSSGPGSATSPATSACRSTARARSTRCATAASGRSRSTCTRTKGATSSFGSSRDADVFVENYRPGVLDRLGLGYDASGGREPTARLRVAHRVRAGRPVRREERVRHGHPGLRRLRREPGRSRHGRAAVPQPDRGRQGDRDVRGAGDHRRAARARARRRRSAPRALDARCRRVVPLGRRGGQRGAARLGPQHEVELLLELPTVPLHRRLGRRHTDVGRRLRRHVPRRSVSTATTTHASRRSASGRATAT